jgi:hypothetical protein
MRAVSVKDSVSGSEFAGVRGIVRQGSRNGIAKVTEQEIPMGVGWFRCDQVRFKSSLIRCWKGVDSDECVQMVLPCGLSEVPNRLMDRATGSFKRTVHDVTRRRERC